MVERIKNKKGFTIIEIMVVIALIGILAAVLVPQFGSVKERARDSGVLTNAKMVEAYVASEIDNWTADDAVGATAGTDDLLDEITTYFTTDGNELANPYTGVEGANAISVNTGSAAVTTGTPGVINVVVNADETADTLSVIITGCDADGNLIKSTQRTVTR